MPYNLRKRKAPEPVGSAPTPVVKAKKASVKSEPTKDEPAAPKSTNKKQRVEQPNAAEPAVKPVTKRQKAEPKEEAAVVVTEPKPVAVKTPRKQTAKSKAVAAAEPSEEPPVVESKEPVKLDTTIIKSRGYQQLVFGSDTCGELGFSKIGITKKKPTPVPIKEPIKQVACGPMHTLSLTDSGLVYSYGCNDEGALGRKTDGDENLEATPTIVELKNKVTKITSGDSHGAALTDKNEVFIWGNFRDEHGSVGLTPECDGQATYIPFQIMPGTKFKDIASGSNHMLLLDGEGVVYSFGVGAQGQLGRISAEQIEQSDKTTAITKENRELFLTPKTVSMKNVDPQREFVCDAIFAGNFSSFATNTDKKKNRLAGWGLNNYYQLGYKGQQKNQLVQHFPRRATFTCSTSFVNVACGQHHTLFLTKTGRLYAAGRNEYGMLGIGKEMADKKEVCPSKLIDGLENSTTTICAGINTSFAVSDGKLYAWGMNGLNLGLESGDDNDLMEPSEVKSLSDKEVISVSSGSSFTAVIVK